MILLTLGLPGCADTGLEPPPEYRTEQTDRIRDQYGTMHGNRSLFEVGPGAEQNQNDGGGGPGIGVNVYMWRAALETIDFMPLTQADPFGGVIITDWYSPPETPEERFKLNVYILGRVLRADGLKVSVFRQITRGDGWVDSAVDPGTATGIEDSILTRARELRIAALGSAEG